MSSLEPTGLLICPPVALEYGFAARSGAAHTVLSERLSAFVDCDRTPATSEVLDLQNALWNQGLLRAVGPVDLLIAAYAMTNGAAVLHYDSDYEHIASVAPAFRHEWVVERGSL